MKYEFVFKIPKLLSFSVATHGGCVKDSDCLFSEACIDNLCQDPCACGNNAVCHIRNHRPTCSCAHGFVGNPALQCFRGK